MEETQTKNKPAKIIAWCVVVVAIAVVYIFTTTRNKVDSSVATSSTSMATTSQNKSAASDNSTATTTAASYKDGIYTASADYRTPEDTESIDVKITVQNGTVTDSMVSQTAKDRNSVRYQSYFAENYRSLVVGKKIEDIHLSRVSGSSLTSSGFNDALEQIKTQAASQA